MKRTLCVIALISFAGVAEAAGQTTAPPAGGRQAGGADWPTDPCVMEALRAAGRFTKFVELLEASGLDAVIRAQKAVTVFAPNDEAFAKVTAGETRLLTDDPEFRRQFLSRHVLLGRLRLAGRAAGRGADGVKDLDGRAVARVEVDCGGGAGGCSLGSPAQAEVIRADVRARNGYFNELDRVLLSPFVVTKR